MPERRPRLALPFTILTASDAVRLVAGEEFRYTLNGPGLETWLPEWLRSLDGRQTLAEAVTRLPAAIRDPARNLANRLYGERVLIDGTAAEAHQPQPVAWHVAGDAAWANGWIGPGGGVAVYCQDRLDYEAALRIHRDCRQARTKWIWATTGPMGRAYVGPLFLPDAGPCVACLLYHFRRLSPTATLYDDLVAHAKAGGEIPPVPFPEVGLAVLRGLIDWKVSLLAEADEAAALYRLHVIETATLEVSSHRVFVDPECPECGRRA